MKNMNEEREQDQDIRANFYGNSSVQKYINTHGIPKTSQAFRDMVGSGSSEKLESKEGLKLIACLGHVCFRGHAQQINIMDKSSGRTIASIRR